MHEALVDIGAGAVIAFATRDTRAAPYGQPPVIIEEFFKAGDIVKADPGWRAAMTRPGLTDDEITLVKVDPFSAGYFGREAELGRRLVSAVSYYRAEADDNGYASPIEGVVALVDLVENRVVDLVDEEEIVAIPRKRRNYDRASLPPPRRDLRPLNIVQPEGSSFTVDGWKVDWQNWSFRIGFTPREGLVLHQLGIRDQGREGPILHRASVTEMVVPYADPTANHVWKSAFDAGEYGLGKLANALELGCDCLGLIHYFDVPWRTTPAIPPSCPTPSACTRRISACCGNITRCAPACSRRAARAASTSPSSRRSGTTISASTGIFARTARSNWRPSSPASSRPRRWRPARPIPGAAWWTRASAGRPTSISSTCACTWRWTARATPSPSTNSCRAPWGTDNPHGNVFDTTSRVLANERDAAREADGRTGRYWKVTNPNRTNSVGKPTGYKLIVQPSPLLLA